MGRYAAVVAAMAAATVSLTATNQATAAHPCGPPYFKMTLQDDAHVGELATFRYLGPAPARIDWGDGTSNWRRRVVRDQLRHRFRRTGRLTVTVIQRGFGCCDSQHVSCSEPEDVVRHVRVRVRR